MGMDQVTRWGTHRPTEGCSAMKSIQETHILFGLAQPNNRAHAWYKEK